MARKEHSLQNRQDMYDYLPHHFLDKAGTCLVVVIKYTICIKREIRCKFCNI